MNDARTNTSNINAEIKAGCILFASIPGWEKEARREVLEHLIKLNKQWKPS